MKNSNITYSVSLILLSVVAGSSLVVASVYSVVSGKSVAAAKPAVAYTTSGNSCRADVDLSQVNANEPEEVYFVGCAI